jgi:hypothetical protein
MARIDCVCPVRPDGTLRHPNGDTVTLRKKLDFRSALQARNTVILIKQEDADANAAEILAALTEVYMLVGIESWTLQDARGKPVEVTRAAIRAFVADHPIEAQDVGDEADGLYSEAVILPLVKRAATYSPPTPMSASTSVTNGSRPAPRKRSKPSSITTSPTVVTERMSASPDGGYS